MLDHAISEIASGIVGGRKNEMSMSQRDDTLHGAQEFLGRMGSGAEPAEIAKLFSENIVRFQMLEDSFAVSQATTPVSPSPNAHLFSSLKIFQKIL